MKFLLLTFILCLTACSTSFNKLTSQAIDTKDWVTDGVFTTGVEGPAVDKFGYLYAVNHTHQGTIGIVRTKNDSQVYLSLPNGSIGNGIRFDKQNNMYIADYVNHKIWQYKYSDRSLNVYAHQPKMNQPNDLAIMNNGILFASDPNWKKGQGQLWRVNRNGSSELLESNMGTTNGIEVSPDNKYLYVNESKQKNVWRYALDANGNISDKNIFYQFQDFGLDGMRTDNQGNLYIARYGAGKIDVLSPQGKLIRSINLKGKYPTNIAFGGPTGKQLFITMQKRGAIETYINDIPGRNF